MTDQEYKEFEKKVEIVQKYNNELILDFKKLLKKAKLTTKTINNHVLNIDFFANDFLLRYEIIELKDGIIHIDTFLGDYYIRKTMWSSKSATNLYVASFKKFYTMLYEKDIITLKELNELKDLIKEEKKYWIEQVVDYWDMDNDDFF